MPVRTPRSGDPRSGLAGGGAADRVEDARRANRDFVARRQSAVSAAPAASGHAWKRQSWTLPREQARAKAREFLEKYPPAAYWSAVESWRVLPGDRIEFTMRRLPSAD